MDVSQIRAVLGTLFAQQLFAVLATVGERTPHLNIVSFAAADELGTILFATPRQTAKFANLQARPGVSLFVDNRSNRPRDLEQACGVEIAGRASETAGDAHGRYRELFLARFPELEEFVASAGTALVAVHVSRYDLVDRFQDVVFWEPGA